MQKPNFLIVGVARCGTTSLFYYLKQHPEISFPEIKEPKFFSSVYQTYPHNGPGDFSVDNKIIKSKKAYYQLFQKFKNYKCIGEASSDYFYYHEHTIPLIKKELGDIKIIICIRNPIDRSFSAYNNLIRDSRERLSFYDGLISEESRIKNNYDWMWHYSRGSLYSQGIQSFQESFSNVKIILNEDLELNTKNIVQEVFEFLGVDPGFTPVLSDRYSTSGRPRNLVVKILTSRIGLFSKIRNLVIKLFPRNILEIIAKHIFAKEKIDLKSKKYLKNFFYEDILNTEILIKRNLNSWK